MSDRNNATHSKGERQNEQKPKYDCPPPPYPGIPGADVTSDTAPLCPSQPGAPGPQPHVTQPKFQINLAQAGYYPQLASSAPSEQSSPYTTNPQSKERYPIPPNSYPTDAGYPPQQCAPGPRSYAPLSTQEGSYIPGSQPREHCPTAQKSCATDDAHYPKQQYAPGYEPLTAHAACPRYVNQSAGPFPPQPPGHAPAAAAAQPREHECSCEDCAACLVCTAVGCECTRCLAECLVACLHSE